MKKPFLLLSAVCLLILNIGQVSVSANSINTVNVVSTAKTTKVSESLTTKNKPNVQSDAAIVMEASTGTILYAKNIHDTYYPASITKILTSLVAIENSSMNEIVDFSKKAVYDVDLDSSRIGIDVGEKLTMEQSLYGIMLESANEVSYAIGEHISGNVESFAALMNKKAKELGCLDSNFVNPHGLPDDNHYTTAYDMALISRAAINNEEFRKITGTRTYSIPPTNLQKETRWLANHHKFVKGAINFDGIIGGKTGYTSKAKYTLVTFAERNGMTLISVIMHCDNITNEYADTSALLNYGFDNYSIFNIAEMENSNKESSSDLFTKYTPMFNMSTSDLSISPNGFVVLPNSISFEDAKKDVELVPENNLKDGQNIIGSMKYTYKGTYVGSADIIYNKIENKSELVNNFIPVPTKTEIYSGIASTASDDESSLKKVIIGIIIGVIIFSITLYIIFVELPYRRRKSAYTEKRKRKNSHYSKRDYVDF
ncbi:MAG: putative secreted protein [Anaerocolumna sp.]|nr:putative secreted protein [Anaerocolumna sp.]